MTIEKTTLKRGAFILPLLIARLGPKIKAEPEIPSRKLLTREEELDLGIKIQNGKRLLLKEKLTDEDLLGLQSAVTAINRFVTQNRGLVVSIAKRYLGRGVKFDDLIQEGNIGLIKGAEKFDPDRGTRFSTYATRWIRKSVTQAVNNQGKTIRTPSDLSDEIKRFKYTRQRLHQELRHEPSIPEIAAALGIDPKKITNVYLRVLQLRTSSLDEPHNPDDPESGPLSDFIPDASPLPPQVADENARHQAVQHALDSLKATPKNIKIFKYIFGLLDGEEHTLEEAKIKFGIVSIWEARKIKTTLVHQLRHPRNARHLRDYYK